MAEIELPNHEELRELKRENFTKRVALVTAIFAVVLAITSLGGNNAMKGMLLAQQQSSDQWAFYQSKVMREHLYRTAKARIETSLLERGTTMSKEARNGHEALMTGYGEEEVGYRAIVMSSISTPPHSRSVFYFAVGSAMLGCICSLNGYLLLFRIPFFH